MPEWLLPPNLITYARLVLAPMAAMAIAGGRHRDAFLLVAVAGFSDGLDGFLARQFGWRSRLGSYLDPVADKLLLVLVFLALAWADRLSWWVVGLFLLRDIWILGMVGYAWRVTLIRDFPPRVLGKVTTVSQIVLAVTMLVVNAFPEWAPLWMKPTAMGLACLFTAISGWDYTVVAWRRYRAWKAGLAGGARIDAIRDRV